MMQKSNAKQFFVKYKILIYNTKAARILKIDLDMTKTPHEKSKKRKFLASLSKLTHSAYFFRAPLLI